MSFTKSGMLLVPVLALAVATGTATHSGGAATGDWLVSPPTTKVTVVDATVGGRAAVTMSNGLISRTWLVVPNWASASACFPCLWCSTQQQSHVRF